MNCASRILDVEVNPANITWVRLRYRVRFAEATIALSALYQLHFVRVARMGTVPAPHGHFDGGYAVLG